MLTKLVVERHSVAAEYVSTSDANDFARSIAPANDLPTSQHLFVGSAHVEARVGFDVGRSALAAIGEHHINCPVTQDDQAKEASFWNSSVNLARKWASTSQGK